jgi:microcystin-dependent protein
LISYAGVPLPLVTPDLEAWLGSYLDANRIEWFNTLDANSPELTCSTRTRERSQPSCKLSTLVWPTDLSRFGTALYVATTAQLKQILTTVDASKPRAAALLKIGSSISVPMSLLEPVQITGAPVNPVTLAGAVANSVQAVGPQSATDGLWLLPLVDSRYYLITGVTYSELTQTTWQTWLEAVHSSCGITCTVHAVSSEFLIPGQLYYPQGNTPGITMLADSAATTIGRRYVRQLTGAFELQRYSDGLTKYAPVNGFKVIAGGRQISNPMVLPYLYTFRWHESGSTSTDISTIAAAQWPSNAYWAGSRTITMRCTKPIDQDAAALAFAKAWGVQHSSWRFLRNDCTYAGAVPYVLTGGDDRVEIKCDSSTCTTRVYARHSEWIDSLGVLFPGQTTADGDNCGKGGGGGGPEICPRVSGVTCTAGFMIVSYQLQCEAVTEPIGQPPAGGPVGTIAMWSVAATPDGWLECNGQTFDATAYPELFVALGGNTWNVPDLRDKFVRGLGATGKGNLRDAKPYKTGLPVNPFTAAAAGSHSHTNAPGTPIMVAPGTSGMTVTGYTNTGTTSTAQAHTHTVTGGDSETVPEHVILKYIIKART